MKPNIKTNRQRGFTLIELLVVISVIGLLSSVVLVTVNKSRANARDVVRAQDLINITKALELYYTDHGNYPITFAGEWPVPFWICDGIHMNDYVPGLVPEYMAALPGDPALDCGGSTHGMAYASDGREYKIVTHSEGAYRPSNLNYDPAAGSEDVDCTPGVGPPGDTSHYAIWTNGTGKWFAWFKEVNTPACWAI
jgi:prepilin-type N-terminal cleavage/methylation domain-containing protein